MSSYVFWGIYKQHVSSFNYGKIQTTGAVLVAISIPIFTNQLEKSREATDAANARAAYAEAQVDSLDNDGNGGNATTEVTTQATDFTYSKIGNPKIGDKTLSVLFPAKGTYAISVDKDGKVTATKK